MTYIIAGFLGLVALLAALIAGLNAGEIIATSGGKMTDAQAVLFLVRVALAVWFMASAIWVAS